MKQSTIMAIIVGAMFAICATGCIIISVVVDDGEAAIARIGLLTAFFATSVASIVGLIRQDSIEKKVDAGNQLTHELSNGKMEAKIRGVVRGELTSLLEAQLEEKKKPR